MRSLFFNRCKNYFLRAFGIQIGEGTILQTGFRWLPGLEKNIILGRHVIAGMNLHIFAHSTVRIGDFVLISHDVSISNGSHDINTFKPFGSCIDIGAGCWIGIDAKIVATKACGLSIGNNAIIGAGALVINDVPNNAVVGGVPAKILSFRSPSDVVWHCNGGYSPNDFTLYPYCK